MVPVRGHKSLYSDFCPFFVLDEETPNEQSSDEDQLPASDQQDAVVQAQTDPPSTSTAQPYEVRLKVSV